MPSVEETNKEKATIASTKTGPELDRILINDLPMQLASYLDQCALYGCESADRLNQCALGTAERRD